MKRLTVPGQPSNLQEDAKKLEKSKNFFTWVQEFSKKVIVIVFGMYIITTIFSLILVYLSWQSGMISGIDTLITETNQTLRDIVGGYLVKAGVENAVKIGGSYFVTVTDAKLKETYGKIKSETIENDDPYNSNNDDPCEGDTTL